MLKRALLLFFGDVNSAGTAIVIKLGLSDTSIPAKVSACVFLNPEGASPSECRPSETIDHLKQNQIDTLV